jgi:hypothetical protein
VLDRHLRKHEAKPTGPDVILVHRLLKNAVRESTGIDSYALLTEAVVRAAGLDSIAAGFPTHSEDYEHIGRVTARVLDLAPVWIREREARRVRVEADSAWMSSEASVPVPRDRMWELLTEPRHKRHWRSAVTITVDGNPTAPMGVGTVHHCAHGEQSIVEEVVDWRPPHYVTYEQQWPLGARAHVTNELHGDGPDTVVRILSSPPRGPNVLSDLFVVRPAYWFLRRSLAAMNAKFVADLAALAVDPTYETDSTTEPTPGSGT